MPARRVSRETPRQWVPSFDQRVTQWMSVWMSSMGSAWSSSQVHEVSAPLSSRMPNLHSDVSIRGEGPAESTGKSSVRYCPGGRFGSLSRRRPPKPREITAICPLSRA
jgi:hypothetical protein